MSFYQRSRSFARVHFFFCGLFDKRGEYQNKQTRSRTAHHQISKWKQKEHIYKKASLSFSYKMACRRENAE